MVDFAKSLFGFGNYKKESSLQSPTPPPSAHSSQEQHHKSNTEEYPQSHLSQQQHSHRYQPPHMSEQSHQFPQQQQQQQQSGTNKFFPKTLVSAAPTTAVANHSSVYGTTSTTTNNYPEAYLNQTFKNNIYNPQQQQQQQAQQPPPEQQQSSAPYQNSANIQQPYGNQWGSSQDQDANIITIDKTGNKLSPASRDSPIKGKLKVTILEAKDIFATQPYVVCSFESSEFVTNAPDSYGKSPVSSFGHNNNQGHNGPRNMYNSNHGPSPKALPMKNSGNLFGQRPSMYQRQLSTPHLNLPNDSSNPIWNHDTIFDVVGLKSELDISVYDGARDDAFLGHVRISPSTDKNNKNESEWLQLGARITGETVSSGHIKIKWEYTSFDNNIKRSYGPDDFHFLRLLGKGTFGQVFQVRKKDTNRVYAMKILSKKVIVKKKEIAHTIGERNILVRTSAASSPFIVGLKFSFQTPSDLFLVTDFMSGGELFFHLQKEGRFNEDRSKFYTAELILALEHLHDNDIVYRDLKPENILLDANGHIALCDFGLSKADLNMDGTTNTFCGTTEYLAPEVLLDEQGYTKMVDFWSLGVLIFEMTCGWSPFHAENTQQMYKNIAFGKVRFPKDVLSPEGRSFVKGLLNRNPKHRLGATDDARELKAHPFFADIDWDLLRAKNIPPPFKPHIVSETDISNFDTEFTSENTSALKRQMEIATTPLSPGIQANFKGFTYVDDSTMDDHFARSYRANAFRPPGSFIPGDPNLPPDEEVLAEQIEEEDEMEVDEDQHMDDEFVNGRFDL
ncbi:putative serine/threonine-protein kinase [Chlamydia trachomatis]|nr:putative serine/threonine-protein kinase [Chlamydia trachomatis]